MRTIYRGGRSYAHTTPTHGLLLAALVTLLYAPTPALAQSNITVDNTDPSIVYSGDWEQLHGGELDFGRTHELTADPTATAVFEFTGTAIYFLAPLWPFPLTTGISLDGAPPDTLDLQDPASVGSPANANAGETVMWSVVWSRTGLLDAQHTLTVSVVPDPSGAESFAILDALIYTSDNVLTPSTPVTPTISASILSVLSSQPATTGTSAASTGDKHQNKTGLSIALGIVCTVFGLLVLYALRWLWRRRQLARQEAARSAAFDLSSPQSNAPSSPEMAQAGPGPGTRRGVYTYTRPRSQRELAAAAAAAAALEEEEEERERERERERRRRRPARGPSGLRHSTVLGADEGEDVDANANGGANGHGHGQASVRRKRSAGPGDAVLGTIPERRESYVGGGGAVGGVGDASDPPWREVDDVSRYPRGNQRTSRTS